MKWHKVGLESSNAVGLEEFLKANLLTISTAWKKSKLVVIKTSYAFCRFMSATFCCRTGRRRSSISCVNPCLKSVECQVIPSYLDSRDVLEWSHSRKRRVTIQYKILEHPFFGMCQYLEPCKYSADCLLHMIFWGADTPTSTKPDTIMIDGSFTVAIQICLSGWQNHIRNCLALPSQMPPVYVVSCFGGRMLLDLL